MPLSRAAKSVLLVQLSARHRRTDAPDFRLSKLATPPTRIRIVPAAAGGHVRMIYEDDHGTALAAAEHEALYLAIGAAELEFGVAPSDWQRPAS